jgi:hypothetical protein
MTALALVQPGMVLSDELLDPQGQVLLRRGAVLSEQAVAALARHGIEMVPVVCTDAPAALEVDRSAVQARLDRLFRHNDPDNHDDWGTGILRRYVQDFRLGKEMP